MMNAREVARAFIAEQSEGEWGPELERQDARKLAKVIAGVQTDAYLAAMDLAVSMVRTFRPNGDDPRQAQEQLAEVIRTLNILPAPTPVAA